MSLIFEPIYTDGLAEISYLVGDDETGTGAVFDPRPDVEIYLQLARTKGVAITHVFETHIHADLVSGARELCARVGTAKIYASHEGGASYGFSTEAVEEGSEFKFGSLVITAKFTPGHTPEHLSYLLAEEDHPELPWGVLSGDSLFVGSAGRPDLLGEGETGKLAALQFQTLREFYLKLPDSVIVYPAHGSGSPCGAEIGDRLTSTIGFERAFNPFLQIDDLEAFTQHCIKTAPPIPKYYPRMKKVNAEGPEILGGLPQVRALPPAQFQEAIRQKNNLLVDTRSMFAFGGAHIADALNLGATPTLSIWAGTLLDPARPLLLVLEHDSDLEDVVRLFLRTGFTNFAGYLVGGMKAWDLAGNPFTQVPQISVHQMQSADGQLQVLDVRTEREWKGGHVPGARHIVMPQLEQRVAELDASKPTAVYCASGYRASIATSVLKKAGFKNVSNVPGSWHAWKEAGFPIEK